MKKVELTKNLKEVEKRLMKLSKSQRPGKWIPESYIGGDKGELLFLNIKVPYIRNEQKLGYSFSKASIKDQWKTWDYIWNNTKYYEVALSAVHFVNSSPIEELYEHRKMLIKWLARVDNWALSDEVSNFISRLLEYKRSEFLPILTKWNKSSNPWEKRQSMVGLLFYSRFRTKVLPCSTVLKFVRPHLKDSHYYVQKAVGWTLRECWNLYPDQTYKFLTKHAKDIPPAGWTACVEKLSRVDKEALKAIRKS